MKKVFTGVFTLLLLIFAAASAVTSEVSAASDVQEEVLTPYGNLLTRNLSEGMTGTDVVALQSMLYKLGYLTKDVDGIFDTDTKEALIAFQTDQDVQEITGVVDEATKQALNTVLSELPNDAFYLIYDVILEPGMSYTIQPIFYDKQEKTVTLSCDSPLISISGTTITALSPGSTEVTAECEGQEFTFFVCIRDAKDVASKVGELRNANNLNAGLNQRVRGLASYTGDPETMTLFAGDCYLDERLFLTDFSSRFPDSNIYSLALSGSTAKQWLGYITYFDGYQPDSLLLCVGVNDLRHGETVPGTIRNLEKLFETIHAYMPDTTIYWWKIIPHAGADAQYHQILAINAAIEEYAKDDDHLVVADTYETMADENGVADLTLYMDELHPNTEGYDRLFETTKEAGLKPASD